MLAFNGTLDNRVLRIVMEDFRAPLRQVGLSTRLRRMLAVSMGGAAVLGRALYDRFSRLHREILPMITVFALVLLIGLGLAVQQPILFTAQASMTVPRDQGLSLSSWSHVTGSAPDNIQGGVTQSATDDLSSQRLILQTIATIGLGKLYPDLAALGAAGHETALRRVSENLKLQQAAGSSQLSLRFSHTSPSMAALVLNTLMQAYLAELSQKMGQSNLADPSVGLATPGADPEASAPGRTEASYGTRPDLERQLAGKRQALYRLERAIAAQAPMVHLSWQGMTNSLRADGHEHSFGFNTRFQALQIERQQTLIAIGRLKQKLARLKDQPPVRTQQQQSPPTDGTLDVNRDPSLKTPRGFDTVRILTPAKPPLRGHHQGIRLAPGIIGIGTVLALMTGLLLSTRRSGFGSAKLAGKKLDLPVLARIGVLPQSGPSLSRLGFE